MSRRDPLEERKRRGSKGHRLSSYSGTYPTKSYSTDQSYQERLEAGQGLQTPRAKSPSLNLSFGGTEEVASTRETGETPTEGQTSSPHLSQYSIGDKRQIKKTAMYHAVKRQIRDLPTPSTRHKGRQTFREAGTEYTFSTSVGTRAQNRDAQSGQIWDNRGVLHQPTHQYLEPSGDFLPQQDNFALLEQRRGMQMIEKGLNPDRLSISEESLARKQEEGMKMIEHGLDPQRVDISEASLARINEGQRQKMIEHQEQKEMLKLEQGLDPERLTISDASLARKQVGMIEQGFEQPPLNIPAQPEFALQSESTLPTLPSSPARRSLSELRTQLVSARNTPEKPRPIRHDIRGQLTTKHQLDLREIARLQFEEETKQSDPGPRRRRKVGRRDTPVEKKLEFAEHEPRRKLDVRPKTPPVPPNQPFIYHQRRDPEEDYEMLGALPRGVETIPGRGHPTGSQMYSHDPRQLNISGKRRPVHPWEKNPDLTPSQEQQMTELINLPDPPITIHRRRSGDEDVAPAPPRPIPAVSSSIDVPARRPRRRRRRPPAPPAPDVKTRDISLRDLAALLRPSTSGPVVLSSQQPGRATASDQAKLIVKQTVKQTVTGKKKRRTASTTGNKSVLKTKRAEYNALKKEIKKRLSAEKKKSYKEEVDKIKKLPKAERSAARKKIQVEHRKKLKELLKKMPSVGRKKLNEISALLTEIKKITW